MQRVIQTIQVADGVSIINISGLTDDVGRIAAILRDVANRGINVDVICQTTFEKNNKVTFSFTIADGDVHEAVKTLAPYKKQLEHFVVEVDSGNTKVCVAGKQMTAQPGVAAAVYEALAQAGVHPKLTSTSEVDISIVMAEHFADAAVTALEKLMHE